MTDITSTTLRNTRAACLILEHAELRGLPLPSGVNVSRGVDTEISAKCPRVSFRFETGEDLYAWAEHLQVEILVKKTVSTVPFTPKVVTHLSVTAEWLDEPITLTAVVDRAPAGASA